MAHLSLPWELVDAIIDDIHSTRDLKAFSLTCHTFYLPTRRILFRQFKLTQSQLQSDMVLRFHELCVVSPHIPPLVQTLDIGKLSSGSTFLAAFDIISWVLQFMVNVEVIKLYHVTIDNWIPSTVLLAKQAKRTDLTRMQSQEPTRSFYLTHSVINLGLS
ncbi:hypothetical protein F5146DRAFT_1132398 [Armillaria mellea]|nr:hypothetical protein F5146DRAFT_1132398 [Armillaria mellea]